MKLTISWRMLKVLIELRNIALSIHADTLVAEIWKSGFFHIFGLTPKAEIYPKEVIIVALRI